MSTKARPTAGRPRTTRSSAATSATSATAASPSDLELRAAAVRHGNAHYAATLATACPAGHAPQGQPCSPPAERGPQARGGFCAARAVESARAAGRLAEIAQEAAQSAFASAMITALDAQEPPR